jgi:V8-like Glu-specific endopeptidase
LRALLLLSIVVVLGVTPSALGVTRVVGGSPVDVRNAPWSALVLHRAGAGGSLCSGAIIDATHVLTAAHCVVEGGVSVPSTSLTVRAGVTNAATPLSSDSLQDRAVQSFRVHRGYVDNDRSGGDDVAVLTLATPFDLNGQTARAIALPGAALRVKVGDAVTLAGFGLKAVGGTIDGTLNGMNATLVDQTECLRAPYDVSNAVLLCAFSGSSSPCGGDSGGALVLIDGSSPVVVGVTRAASCAGNSSASFANVTAPEILQFIQGNDDPPAAPRPLSPPALEHPTAQLQVGQTLRCSPGSWSGTPSFTYGFIESATHSFIGGGPSPTYTLRDGDAGRAVICRVTASNAGGTGFDESLPVGVVQNAGEVSVPATTARRGGTAVLRPRLVDWVRPLGAVTICARLAPRIGGKTCRPTAPAGAEPTVVVRLPVRRNAPVVRARVQVTARATDGRAATAVGYVSVR